MKISEIVWRLNLIFREVFDDDSINITLKMAAVDIALWDSLNNIRLMISIEEAFGIRFDTAEITGFSNVGEIVQAISDKSAK